MKDNLKKTNSKEPRRKLPLYEAQQIKITPYQREILLGMLLGDGSLKKPTGKFKNSRLQTRHSILQKDWIEWKIEQLSSLNSKTPSTTQKADGFSQNEKITYRSRALPCFTELEKEVNTQDGQLDLSKPWLNDLTERSLMVWWLDDGGLHGPNNLYGKLNTQGFLEAGSTILSEYLKEKWKVEAEVRSYANEYKGETKTYYYIHLEGEALERFLKMIMPYIPCESMVYKVFLEDTDESKHKDWIATMKKAMPKFSSICSKNKSKEN